MRLDDYMLQVRNLLEEDFAAKDVCVLNGGWSPESRVCTATLDGFCLIAVIVEASEDDESEAMEVRAYDSGPRCDTGCHKTFHGRWLGENELRDIVFSCSNFILTAKEI